MKQNILITGGAGYIGSHVVKLLGQTGNYNLTIVDNLSTGSKDAVLYGDLHIIDLAETDKLESLFHSTKFQAVIHFAASIEVPESVANPVKYYRNNTVNTLNLIDICNRHGVEKFIFSSTAAVYGDYKPQFAETDIPKPVNPYGRSKLMNEMILRDIAATSSTMKYVILRYFNVAGADPQGKIGQNYPNATHLIKVAAETACGLRPQIQIYGTDYPTPDGTCIRDYIHVTDLASAHLEALNYLDQNPSETFNCGYGHGYSVKETLETMKEVSGKDFKTINAPRRAGDPPQVVSINKKILQKTNWKPTHNNLKTICQTALDWEKQKLQ
ncbi:MAG: UDP-glucose 4-epimerase GalE [Deltaproteobacteria bacterium]|jgi:UDP-glucose 4-epimerase|nr:UDP-glucose 4-epimerase GalE [Deltaproteobacteria bacterium]